MRSIVLACVVLVCWCEAAVGQTLRGRVEQRSFVGPVTGQLVHFNIYLPEGYDGGSARYPVVYHLHGLGSSQHSHNAAVPLSFEGAQDAGVIGPVIVVFPNGYEDAFWADSIGMDKPAETDVVDQLVPHVDANFRTIPRPGARVVQGFSMGGFGAAKFYTKYPDVFVACVEYDGALVEWPTMRFLFPDVASGVFGNDESYFDEFSPWEWATEHADVLRSGAPVRMVAGPLYGWNRDYRNHLIGLGIPVDYVETSCGHDLNCLLERQGLASAAFFAEHLELGRVIEGGMAGGSVEPAGVRRVPW